jgi:chemotaxis protein MotA
MLALIGIIIVFAAVLGGFLLEKGNPFVLMQPAELLIIGGAAAGIIVVANTPAVIGKMARGVAAAFRSPALTRERFLENLRMLYEVFAYTQRAGLLAMESDLEDPHKSQIFSNYPRFLKDAAIRNFVCDTMRIMVIGRSVPNELERLMDLDIQVQRSGRRQPVNALMAVADALPGLGIVAAVLGVVITMGAVGGSATMVGQNVAAALVGTFLGIFLCYGVVGPLASRLEHLNEGHHQFLLATRIAIAAFARGSSPFLAVEYARRSMPVEVRPGFLELEAAIRRNVKIPAVPTPGVPAVPAPATPEVQLAETPAA